VREFQKRTLSGDPQSVTLKRAALRECPAAGVVAGGRANQNPERNGEHQPHLDSERCCEFEKPGELLPGIEAVPERESFRVRFGRKKGSSAEQRHDKDRAAGVLTSYGPRHRSPKPWTGCWAGGGSLPRRVRASAASRCSALRDFALLCLAVTLRS
jgi:hypothetical protein